MSSEDRLWATIWVVAGVLALTIALLVGHYKLKKLDACIARGGDIGTGGVCVVVK
jgi:hypothetical protein